MSTITNHEPKSDDIRHRIFKWEKVLWDKFYSPESHLLYEREFTDAGQFPSPAEMAACIPSPRGAGTGMEDSCLNGGWHLDGMLSGHRVTGDQTYADKARLLFQGLVRLGSIGKTRGFVARSFAPGRTDVYPNSSADQYTAFVFAMWAYATSSVATEEERQTACGLAVDVARLLESFHDDIPTDNMEPSIYGDTAAIRPDRACRLLQAYKTAYALSGDRHWEDLYRDRIEADGRARLRCHYGHPDVAPVFLKHAVYGYVQSQAAQYQLRAMEQDAELRRYYELAMVDTARVVLPRVAEWRAQHERPPYEVIPGRWKLFWGHFVNAHPTWRIHTPFLNEHGLRVDAGHHAFGVFIKENEARVLKEAEQYGHSGILARRMMRTSVMAVPIEAAITAIWTYDDDIRKEAAVELRAMLETVDFSNAGGVNGFACLSSAYWRSVEAGIFPT